MRDILDIIRKILPPKLKWQALMTLALMFASAFLEVFSIGLMMPLVSAISDPSMLETNRGLAWFHRLVSPESPTQFIAVCAGLMALFFIVKNIFNYWVICCNSTFTMKVKMHFINRIFMNYISAPYSFFSDTNSAALINHIQQINHNCLLVLQALQLVVSEGLVVITVSLAVFAVMPLVACTIALFGLLTYFLFYRPMTRHFERFGKTMVKSSENMLQTMTQAFGAIKEVKLMSRERQFAESLDATLARNSIAAKRVNDLSQIPRLTLETLTVIVAAAVILLLLFRHTENSSMVFMAAILIAAMFRLIPCISRIQYNLNTVKTGKFFLTQVFNDLKNIPVESAQAMTDKELPAFQKLELAGISFRHSDDTPFLFQNFNLEINRNDCIAITGPTGCGKTTLIDLAMGFLKPTAGDIKCNGISIFEALPAWRAKIGYVSQNFFLFDDTIRANVAFSPNEDDIDDANVARCLKLAQLWDFTESLPGKTNTLIGEGGCRLSGGQRQRLAIARALYTQPEILILDEATSALDNDTEHAFIDALQTLQGSMTIIMIAHRLTSITHCSRVINLSTETSP